MGRSPRSPLALKGSLEEVSPEDHEENLDGEKKGIPDGEMPWARAPAGGPEQL